MPGRYITPFHTLKIDKSASVSLRGLTLSWSIGTVTYDNVRFVSGERDPEKRYLELYTTHKLLPGDEWSLEDCTDKNLHIDMWNNATKKARLVYDLALHGLEDDETLPRPFHFVLVVRRGKRTLVRTLCRYLYFETDAEMSQTYEELKRRVASETDTESAKKRVRDERETIKPAAKRPKETPPPPLPSRSITAIFDNAVASTQIEVDAIDAKTSSLRDQLLVKKRTVASTKDDMAKVDAETEREVAKLRESAVEKKRRIEENSKEAQEEIIRIEAEIDMSNVSRELLQTKIRMAKESAAKAEEALRALVSNPSV
jgi:hypothetical protein